MHQNKLMNDLNVDIIRAEGKRIQSVKSERNNKKSSYVQLFWN
jgi:hypothetical protein